MPNMKRLIGPFIGGAVFLTAIGMFMWILYDITNPTLVEYEVIVTYTDGSTDKLTPMLNVKFRVDRQLFLRDFCLEQTNGLHNKTLACDVRNFKLIKHD